MDRLTVAMLIQSYLPRLGGAELQLAALAPLLRERGVDPVIFTRRYPGLPPYEEIGGAPVHRLPIPGPKPVASLAYTLFGVAALARLRPDIIHAHELLSPASTALATRRLLGTPVVAKVLRGGPLGDVDKLRRRAFGPARLAAFSRQIDAFIVISQEIERELADAGVPAERRIFIPNGVDIDRFTPLDPAARRVLRAELGLPLEAPLLVFAGRLAPEKRVQHLLSLWPEARAAHPAAELLLLGTGPAETDLRAQAGPGVRFLGHQADVAPFLRAADLFALPSATEGLSNALLEALAAGLGVIATAVGGAPDVITSDENGLLVPPDDEPALRAAVLALLCDSDRRARYGRQARARIARDYSLPATADRLRALYDRVRRPAR